MYIFLSLGRSETKPGGLGIMEKIYDTEDIRKVIALKECVNVDCVTLVYYDDNQCPHQCPVLKGVRVKFK